MIVIPPEPEEESPKRVSNEEEMEVSNPKRIRLEAPPIEGLAKVAELAIAPKTPPRPTAFIPITEQLPATPDGKEFVDELAKIRRNVLRAQCKEFIKKKFREGANAVGTPINFSDTPTAFTPFVKEVIGEMSGWGLKIKMENGRPVELSW